MVAKLAPKPKAITNKEIARHRGEPIQTTERPEERTTNSKTVVVMLDGPLRCLTPIPRSDLPHGCRSWEYPYGYGMVTYELDSIDENSVHRYRWRRTDNG